MHVAIPCTLSSLYRSGLLLLPVCSHHQSLMILPLWGMAIFEEYTFPSHKEEELPIANYN